MSVYQIFDWLENHITLIRIICIPIVFLLVMGLFVFEQSITGWDEPYLLFIPVIVSAFIYGTAGGLLTSLICGTLISPIMPLNASTIDMQITNVWFIRTGTFTFIGLLIGMFTSNARKYLHYINRVYKYDEATGLLNRRIMEKDIEKLPNLPGEGERFHYIVIIVLKNFRDIENAFGAEVVNAVVKQIAERITTNIANISSVYRVHFDQIGLIFSDEQEYHMKAKLLKIENISYNPFDFKDFKLHGDIFMGCYKITRVEYMPSFFIQNASSAAIKAVRMNKKSVVYSMNTEEMSISKNLELMGDFKEALDNEELILYYQPKVNINSGMLHSFEGLIRWFHNNKGFIPPNEFIPYVEQSTLIDQLTYYALNQGLEQLKKCNKYELKNTRIAINVSAQNLTDPEFAHKVFHLLDIYGIDGKYLELEITETSFMYDIGETIINMLKKLSERNIVLAIDDFGTGYSSLLYLKKLPVSVIKIDQSFIKGLP